MTYTPRRSRYMIGKHEDPPNPSYPWFYCGLDADESRDYGEQPTWAQALASVIVDDQAHRCLCGQVLAPQVGDLLRCGMLLGFAQEPGMRYARVVGYVKARDVQGGRVLVRLFRPGDGRWPTGEYRRQWLCTPWVHDHPQTELDPGQEPLDWGPGGKFRLPRPA